jgi:hypothetical protein
MELSNNSQGWAIYQLDGWWGSCGTLEPKSIGWLSMPEKL